MTSVLPLPTLPHPSASPGQTRAETEFRAGWQPLVTEGGAEGCEHFLRFITRELGIKMSEAKVPMLRSRLNRRLRALGLASLSEYQRYLFDSAEGAQEMIHFLDAVTTNKTDFFREPHHFEYLVQTVLPALDPGAQSEVARPWRFKLWCAGCSSGEEPYTLAMVLSEFAASRPGFDFALRASDISTRMLERAQLGIYEEEKVVPVPAPLRKKYLLRSRDPSRAQVRVIPALREKISFHRLNFMDADYRVKEQFEVIFFRNVMIYFDKPTQETVLRKLCAQLEPGGYLFVGHSESLAGLRVPVSCVGPAIYQKRS